MITHHNYADVRELPVYYSKKFKPISIRQLNVKQNKFWLEVLYVTKALLEVTGDIDIVDIKAFLQQFFHFFGHQTRILNNHYRRFVFHNENRIRHKGRKEMVGQK